MEEQAARGEALVFASVLTQKGSPRPCQMGRAHLAAGLGFWATGAVTSLHLQLPTQLGSPACCAGDSGTAPNLFHLSCTPQLGCTL